MKVWPLHRQHNPHKRGALKDPEGVIRAFWRTLEKVAAQPQGGAPVARGATREKA
jgi:hypothetical protein